MVDINSFFTMIICILSSILLVILIILGIKLINTVTKADRVLDELEVKIKNPDGTITNKTKSVKMKNRSDIMQTE